MDRVNHKPTVNRVGIEVDGQKIIEWLGWKNGDHYYRCLCSCGNEIIRPSRRLYRGSTISCGCRKNNAGKTHGMSRSKIYNTWSSMIKRCYLISNASYKNYGGRGIKVCDEWKNDFKSFYDYVSKLEHYNEEGYSLDRIDTNGHYEPGNVRWSTSIIQCNNRTNNHTLTIKGETKTLSEWAKIAGISHETLYDRVCKNWDETRLLDPPRAMKYYDDYQLTLCGRTQSIKDWANELGLSISWFKVKIRSGLSEEELIKPNQKMKGSGHV